MVLPLMLRPHATHALRIPQGCPPWPAAAAAAAAAATARAAAAISEGVCACAWARNSARDAGARVSSQVQ